MGSVRGAPLRGQGCHGSKAETAGPLTQEEGCPGEINRLVPEGGVALLCSSL